MNFKDWWEHNKSEYFYSEEDLAEDAYVTGYSEKQAELVSAQARIAELEEQIDLQIPKGVMLAQMARIAELRELIKRLVDVSPGHAGQCSGLKCREPYCYSCNGEDDANEYLQGVWDLCGEANKAFSRTDDMAALAAHDAELVAKTKKAALLEVAERIAHLRLGVVNSDWDCGRDDAYNEVCRMAEGEQK